MKSKLLTILKLIGDQSRLSILEGLKARECSVNELTVRTKLSQSLVSHHLRDLKDGGLVNSNREGKYVYYRLTSRGGKIVSGLGKYSWMLLKLLGDESRQKILFSLKKEACSVSKLVDFTGLSQSLVSHHLRDLREAGLVNGLRDGKWVNYALAQAGQKALGRLEVAGR